MNRPVRLVLHVPAGSIFAKAFTATGDHIPPQFARAKSFTPETAPVRHAQDEASWHQRLSNTEKSGLHHYTDKFHTGPKMNALHRWKEHEEGDEWTPTISRNADEALKKARVHEKHGIIVHRGIGGGLAHAFSKAHDDGQLPGGGTFTEHGYLSTSLVPHVAHQFAHQTAADHLAKAAERGHPEEHVTIHHIIHLRRGVRAGSVHALSQAPEEHEMLVARGAKMTHISFTEHDPTPEAMATVHAHAAATGRTVGHGPGQVKPPRHFILHSVITHHEDV